MTTKPIYEKGTVQVITFDKENISHHIFKANLDKADIAKITKVGNNLEVELNTGEKIVLDDYFSGEIPKELVLETANGQHLLVNLQEFNAEGVATKVDYLGINDFQDYLSDGESTVAPTWAWVATALSIIGIAASAGSSRGHHSNNENNNENNGDKTGPIIKHDILDNSHIKISTDEASQIIILDANGHRIGSGEINQAGHIEITLTRPLQDNEVITITATDNAGNKTTESVNVGDVTDPLVEVNIIDNSTIQIISNEVGSKVEIKDETGKTIGEGVVDSNGQVSIDVDELLNDGDTIVVNVTDNAGNNTTEVIVVGDVTAPIISADIIDANTVEITSNETGTVEITDSDGNIIGRGFATGNDAVDDIQLDRPLTDGETIIVTVIDASDNHQQMQVTAGDVTAPNFISATVDASGTTLTLNYNESLDSTHLPTIENFTVMVGDVVVRVVDISIRGQDVILTLSEAVTVGQNVQVSYTDPSASNARGDSFTIQNISNNNDINAIQDIAGNDATDLSSIIVNNNSTVPTTPTADNTAPQLQSVEVNSVGQLVFHYNEALDGNNLPNASHFTVTVNGQTVTPSSISVTGSDVFLSFIPAIGIGQSVIYSYTDPSLNNDTNAIQDVAGNDANSIAQTTLPAGDNHSTIDSTAPQLQSVEVNTVGQLVFHYNEALDGNNLPNASHFTVTVNGQTVTPSGISVTGNDVLLSFVPAIGIGQSVSYSYTDPSPNNDTSAIQDTAGNDASSIPLTTLAGGDNNSTVDVTAPQLQSVEVNSVGQLVFHYNETLDGNNLPNTSHFTVTVNGQTVTPSSISVTGNDVLLSFIPAIGIGQSVSYSYTDPSLNNDISAIQDTAGNDAVSIPLTTLAGGDNHSNVDTTAPNFVTAAVDTSGTTLTLTYNENLDGSNLPAVSNFTVAVGGVVVSVAGIIVNGQDVILTLSQAVTVGQNVQVSYADPSVNNDSNAIQDIVGNDATDLSSIIVNNNSTVPTTPTADNTAPQLQSVEVNPAGQLVFHYNEALDGNNPPSANDFSININGQLVSPNTITILGNDVFLSFVPAIGIGQSVIYSYTDPSSNNDTSAIQDTTGNDASSIPLTTLAGGDNNSTVDVTAPQLQSVEVNPAGQLVFHYNEALDGNNPPNASHFTVTVNGQTVTPSTISVTGNDVFLSFVPAIGIGQSVSYSYTDPSLNNDVSVIQDVAGNDANSITQTTLPAGDNHSNVDITAPQLQSVEVNPAGQLAFHYNEALDGNNPPNASHFTVTVNGQTVTPSSISVTGNDVFLSFIPAIGIGQSVSYSYTDPSLNNDVSAIQDTAGNDAASIPLTTLAGGDNHSNVDITAPQLQSVEVNPAGQLVFHYNEALDGNNPPNTSHFTVTVNGQTVTPSSISVTGSDVFLSFVPAIGIGQSVSYGYIDPSSNNDTSAIQDVAGNDAASIPLTTLAGGDNHSTIDSTAPILQSVEVNPAGQLVFHYNEALDGANLPNASHFTVTVNGQTVTPSSISVTGNDVFLSFIPAIGIGQSVSYSYTDPSLNNDVSVIQDVAGNDAASIPLTTLAGGDNHSTIDSTAPNFVTAAVDTSGTALTLTYNENLDGSNLPAVSNFTVTVGGVVVSVAGIIVNGQDVILTLSQAVTVGQNVQVSYADPSVNNDSNAIQDIVGNDASDLNSTLVNNNSSVPTTDSTAPQLQSVEVNPAGQLVFHYNEALDAVNLPNASHFTVTVNGQTVTPSTISVTGNDVFLSFVPAIGIGQTVSYSYTDPSLNNDVSAIQDVAGNDAASIPLTTLAGGDNHSNVDITAPQLQSVEVNTVGQLVFHYNETLDGNNPPSANDFSININGQLVSPNTVTISGNDVLLSFIPAIGIGQSVSYSYTDPSLNNDVSAIQDTAGNDANSITQTTLPAGDNHSNVDITAPILQSVEVNSVGQLVFHYNEALDGNNPPNASHFTVTVNGQTVTPSTISVTGNDVFLSFVPAIGIGQTVSYSYTDPSLNNDVSAIQDVAGNDAVSIPLTTLAGDDNHSNVDITAPQLQSVEVNPAGQLVFHYNEALDSVNPPSATNFSITINGQSVAPNTIVVTGNDVFLSFVPAIGIGQSVSYSYTDPSLNNDVSVIQDTAGNDANSIMQTTLPVGDNHSNVDVTAPQLQSVEVNSVGQLVFHYNEALDGNNPPNASHFTVTINGQTVTPSSISVTGNDVFLSFVPAIGIGQTVSYSYTDPSLNNDVSVIQDTAGNDAASIPLTTLAGDDNHSNVDSTAPQLQSVEVNPAGQLVFHYNEALDGNNLPNTSHFTVTVNGQTVTPSSISVTGNDVFLSFVPAIGIGQSVSYSYTDPSLNNDVSAIQDTAGNDAASIPLTTLAGGDNHSNVDITAPQLQSVEVNPAGQLVFHYNEALDGNNLPNTSHFTVTINGQTVTPSSISVTGSDVFLSFVPAIGIGQSVSYSYTDPSPNNDTSAIQDTAGNDAASIPLTTLPAGDNHSTIDNTAPILQSVEVNTVGQLVFHYNEALDANNTALASHFNITINGQTVTPSSISVTGSDVFLSFIPAIGIGQSVSYSYTDPSLNNDVSVIQDVAGNDAASIPLTTLAGGDNHSTIDSTPPPAPIILGAEDNVGAFGNLYSGGLTDDLTPTIYGVAEENSIVTVFVNSLEVGTAIADGSGRWSYEPTLTNPTFRSVQGSNFQITATATDASHNVSPVSNIFDIGTYQANTTQNPITALKEGSLLGLVGLDALGLIQLDNQPIAAYDVNNDLKKVILKTSALLDLAGIFGPSWEYSQAVADILGLSVKPVNTGILGLVAVTSALEITAKDGGTIDNSAIMEFFATVYDPKLLGLTNISLLGSLTLEAWDSRYTNDFNKDTSNQIIGYSKNSLSTLADVNLLGSTKIPTYDQLSDFDQHLAISNVRVYGTTGNDTIQGGAFNDILRGGDGVDTLKGNAGNDWLEGGKDNDFLTGGIGSDTAIYHLLVANDATGGNGTDTWTDFHKGNVITDVEADKIDITELLENSANIGNIQQYVSVTYDALKDQTVLQIDRDGSGAAYAKSDLLILEHVNTTLEELLQNQQIIF